MTGDGLRFAVFGGPRVWRDGLELDLGPPQRRLLLALLMLAGGDAVSMDLIVEVLWEDDPPDTALNVVHRHVGQLRRVLEPDLTSRQPGSYVAAAGTGYRLDVTPDDLDLLALRDLLAGARDAGTVGRAVELAAARAGGGLASARALESLLAPVEADRVTAGIAAADLAVGLGDPQQARTLLPVVQSIAHDHPFDEPLQAALVRILVTAGRRADALAHYGSVRALMDEELGLEPGPQLQAAQRAALEDPTAPALVRATDSPDPAAATARRPAQLPVHTAHVVGRAADLTVVTQRLLASGDGAVVCAFTGMGGIGKTALALQCAQEVLEAYPDGQLYANLHGYDDQAGPAEPGEVLRSFLVALGVAPVGLPVEVDDRAALFRTHVADQRLLLVLDNARDSVQVRSLLPGGAGCGVVVTSRRRLDELAADGAVVVALERLDRGPGLELLRDRIGAGRVDAEPEAADAIVEACHGLPLALAIVAARAGRYRDASLTDLLDELREPSATLDVLSGGAGATDLRRVLSWSYDALSEPAAHLFRCTGVLPGIDLALLTAVSLAGADVAGARRSLDELARANLLNEVAPGRFQAHQLLRAFARELLTDDEEVAARARLVGHYVGSVRNAYLLHGRPPLCPLPEATEGTSPETFRALGEGLAWYLRERQTLAALVLRTAAAGQAVESALLVLDSRPQAQQSSPAGDLLPLTTVALESVTAAGDLPVLGAELRRDLGLLLCRTGRRADGRDQLVLALAEFEAVGDDAGRSSTLRNLARVARFDGDHEAALDYARRSVDLACRTLGGAAEAVATTTWAETLTAAGRYDEAIEAAERSVGLARAHGVVAWEPHALEALADALAGSGEFTLAIEQVVLAREVERRHGLGTGSSLSETQHVLTIAEFQYGAGEREAALESYRRYLERAERYGPLSAEVGIVDPADAALGDPARVRARIAELAG